jgi:hypothetical protein
VRLVDIDVGAVERGARRQGVLERVAIEEGDLTGVAGVVAGWKGREVSISEVERATEVASCPLPDEILRCAQDDRLQRSVASGEFDVVLSCCVLSQLLVSVRDVLGARHAGWPGLKGAIVRRHLWEVVGRVRPWGRGVIVVDLTSTSAIPGLDRALEREWGDLMRVAVREGKCFGGLEPGGLVGVIRREVGSVVEGISVSAPWVWHLGWGKAFLCYGVVMRRK